MGESGSIMRVVVVLGILSLLIGLLYPLDQPPFSAFQTAISTAPDFPVLDNPFTRYTSKGTAVPDNPTNAGIPLALINFVGCNNETTTTMRPDCVNTPDGDESYVEFTNDTGIFEWNWTRKDFLSLTGAEIRKVILTVQCRTTNGTDAFNFGLVWGNNTGGPFQSCPRQERYADVLYEFNTPSGYANNPFEFTPSDPRQAFLSSGGLGRVATGRFTFIRIEVFVTDEVVCTAAAWWDDVGCQIGRFVDIVVKGFLYFVNALSYVIVSVGTAIIFVFTVVASLFISLFNVMTWWLAVPDTPVEVQAIISAVFLGMIAFIVYTSVKLVRGSGGPV